MADQLTTSEEFADVNLKITNDAGGDAVVDGVPVWASSDATIVVATPDATGMKGKISSVAAGDARVTFTADADMGAGVETITGIAEITVVQDPATRARTISVTLGAATPKVAVTPPTP